MPDQDPKAIAQQYRSNVLHREMAVKDGLILARQIVDQAQDVVEYEVTPWDGIKLKCQGSQTNRSLICGLLDARIKAQDEIVATAKVQMKMLDEEAANADPLGVLR